MKLFRSLREASEGKPVPAFLSFDVEPDGFQLPFSNPPEWDGYSATFDFAEQFRSSLAERSGEAPKFGWYFRTDPQIAEVYGRPDHVLAKYPDRIAYLETKKDYFGVHAHHMRWSEQRGLWIHDFADAEWLEHCTRFSLEAYAKWAGAPARRFRSGAGFLTNEIVALVDQCGVQVDLTIEPVAGWGLSETSVDSRVDKSPMVGAYPDCRTAPRLPYRPAHDDFRIPGGRSGRGLMMVPLTTGTVYREKPLWWRIARRLVRGSHYQGVVHVLYPAHNWSSGRFFWDLVERRLRAMSQPYLSLAIRTHVDDVRVDGDIRRLFEALPNHPLSARLRFVDPLQVAPTLVSEE